jgi:hypothetical protein
MRKVPGAADASVDTQTLPTNPGCRGGYPGLPVGAVVHAHNSTNGSVAYRLIGHSYGNRAASR